MRSIFEYLLRFQVAVVSVLLLILGDSHVRAQHVSPCPQVFQYTQRYGETKNQWRGKITLISEEELDGVRINILLDREVDSLGNDFGEVYTHDKSDFSITNRKHLLKAFEPLTINFYVKFQQRQTGIPALTDILLNGKIICTTNLDGPNAIQGDCGRVVKLKAGALITGGRAASISQFPWHAAIYRYTGNNPTYICGGSLITKQHVITAAHCMVDRGEVLDPGKFILYMGKESLKNFRTPTIQEVEVSTVTVHPGFNHTSYHNDLAILTLKNPVQMTDHVRTICLWSNEDITAASIANRLGLVTGWGFDDTEKLSDILQQAQMPVVDAETCIRSDPDFYGHFSSANSFCAGRRNGTSVCNGDSGGGMIFPKDGTTDHNRIWELRGIVSLAAPKLGTAICNVQKYVVFTDIAKYLKWIQNAVYLQPEERREPRPTPPVSVPIPVQVDPRPVPPRRRGDNEIFIIFEEPDENSFEEIIEESERITPR